MTWLTLAGSPSCPPPSSCSVTPLSSYCPLPAPPSSIQIRGDLGFPRGTLLVCGDLTS